MKEVTISWDKCLKANQFDNEKQYLAETGGIYVWIWPGDPARICYVGETTNFYDRFIQHFSMLLGGLYTIFNMTKADDFVDFLKKNYHDREFNEINRERYIYAPLFKGEQAESNSFKRAFLDPDWHKIRRYYLENMLYAFGRITVENTKIDSVLRKEVEGALISSLRKKYDEIAKTALKLRNWRKPQIPIGNINIYPKDRMIIHHEGLVRSELPVELVNIKEYLD